MTLTSSAPMLDESEDYPVQAVAVLTLLADPGHTCLSVNLTHPVCALATRLLEQTAEPAGPEISTIVLAQYPADPRCRAHSVPIRADNHGQQRRRRPARRPE
jgi:hypothetical protein